MSDTVFSALRKKLNEEITALHNVLTQDRVKDMEHYRNITGQLRGLTVALEYVKALESKMEE